LIAAFVVKRWRNEYIAILSRLEGITLRHFRSQFSGEMTRHYTRPKTQPVPVAEPQTSRPMPATNLPEIVPA
jgi:hypothetical protein